jgi:AbrB family looped-hinge helix DNA binding protein
MPTTILSSRYRITLPKELCASLRISPGSMVELSIHDGTLWITPAAKDTTSPSPRPCGLCKGEFTVPDDFNNIDITDTPQDSRSVGVPPTRP